VTKDPGVSMETSINVPEYTFKHLKMGSGLLTKGILKLSTFTKTFNRQTGNQEEHT